MTPYQQKLIRDAISGGNDSIAADLDPVSLLKRFAFDPGGGMVPQAGLGGLTAGSQTYGPPAPDPLEQRISDLLSHKPGFWERFGGGGALPVPSGEITYSAPGRMFLRGLVGGFNARQKPQGQDAASLLRLLQVRSAKGSGDAAAALADARRARAESIRNPKPKIDPLQAAKEAEILARRDAALARAASSRSRMGWKPTTGRGGKGAGGLTYAQAATRLKEHIGMETARRANAARAFYAGQGASKAEIAAAVARVTAAAKAEGDLRLRDLAVRYGNSFPTNNIDMGFNPNAGAGAGPSALDLIKQKAAATAGRK